MDRTQPITVDFKPNASGYRASTDSHPKAFAKTALGRLPTEILRMVTRCLVPWDLAVLARVSPKLRALVELCLYDSIIVPFRPSLWYRRATGADDTPKKGFEGLTSLYRTFIARPDLARMVKVFDIDSRWRRAHSHYGAPQDIDDPYQICEVSLLGGVLQKLENVKHVSLELKEATRLMAPGETCLNVMFPGFESLRAHLQWPVKFLGKLESFDWDGWIIHWLMIGPRLRRIHLKEPCEILPDSVPHEKQDKFEMFFLETRSTLLNSRAATGRNLKSFLEHFTSLDEVSFTIADEFDDDELPEPDMGETIDIYHEGSFANLVSCLDSCIDTLTVLSICTIDWDGEHVITSLPSNGFSHFKALKELDVPNQCLFGRPRNRWAHLSITPPMLFPPSLEKLFLFSPTLAFLDWLARLLWYRDEVPSLHLVSLMCATTYGDSDSMMVYESYPHRALAALKSLNIRLAVECRDGDWQDDWADYELAAIGLSNWQIALGPAISGEHNKEGLEYSYIS
jgi:hypothetical protein